MTCALLVLSVAQDTTGRMSQHLSTIGVWYACKMAYLLSFPRSDVLLGCINGSGFAGPERCDPACAKVRLFTFEAHPRREAELRSCASRRG